MSLRFKLSLTISLTTLGVAILLSIGIVALVDPQFTLWSQNLLEADTQAIQHQVALRNLLWSLLVVDLLAAVLVWFLCWLSLSKGSRALKIMTRSARSMISEDELITLDQLDITPNNEITELAMAMNQMYERFQAISRSQKQFISTITHELRTPLTVLKGNIGLIRLMKKADAESLISMEKEIDRLIRLVNELLLIAQAEEGNIELKMVSFNFKDLFEEIYSQLLVLDNAVHTVVMDQVEDAPIKGDRDRLKQVVLNLGSNAIKYTPRGGKITLGMRKMQNEVCFWVSDTGQGIPEEELSHLFERFFRGKNFKKLTYREGSFGLGLSIVSWILKQHKGRIETESRLGEGTTFYVWLPLNEQPPN
jgi:two-component system OmpR family sensor kinase